MPTNKPRYMITESDSLSKGLAIAGQRWPELREDRGALIRKLLETGIRDLETELAQQRDERTDQLQKIAGSLDVWPSNWREERDTEWPQ